MMPKATLLDGMGTRTKTDIRLPRMLLDSVEQVCYALGIPKNAYFAISVATMTLQLLPLLPGRKRKRLVQDLEKIVLKVIGGINDSL